ncbi:MAG: sigma-70 family RNA polymerase sigma factor [Anaerolineaceae bacterium]|nr:sigma-70 family RNA polymerase sigma factor [Anaerolineaceae bacterium]
MDETKTFTRNAYTDMVTKAEKAGQAEAINFAELYRKNAMSVFYYLYSRVRNVADAEDLTSQTFVTALETLSRLRDPLKFTPWVFTIARNKATDFFRKSQRRPTSDFDEELDQAKATEGGLSVKDRDRLLDLEHLISRLSPLEQEYLRLRIVADLPFAEISSILSEPETRIKKKYYRLLEHLQAQVEE